MVRVNEQVAESLLKAIFNDHVLTTMTMTTAMTMTTTTMATTMMMIMIAKMILR